ncbi:acyl-CoA dehydrogenase family protein [Williamsia sterculiae]|uniref:Acyl-CoA dehydrogenase n=1 Tax=Williamsia sterculiae TaxID=1344003 RepID=A0A1N7EZK4_9NOCA|nr:acyl-CoA dehydrogenase family protein [Williamsia sterculiae]SIR93519.1 Acyl-CoA dehydrogenase [Williamsia sterculiae]
MDFELNDEQTMLRDTVRDVLGNTYDVETLRAQTATDLGWSTDLWKQLAEIGILGLPFAEADGGMDAGPVEVAAVLGEIGRSLAPEPVLDCAFLPGVLIARTADDDQRRDLLTDVAAGDLLLAWAHVEPGDRWPVAQVSTTATERDGGWVLSGTKNPVLHGDCANKIVVSARAGDEIGLFLADADADGVTRTAYRTHDLRRGAQLTFDDAPAHRLGSGDAAEAIAYAEAFAQMALCAEAVGAMEKALYLTTDYLKQRKQFGVPLAKFQTLTQRAADMYVKLELARSLSLYATATLAEGRVDPTVSSRAKLQIGRSATSIGQEAIQMHGGIGMTVEYPVGHYTSRLTAIGHTLGGAEEHLRQLSRSIADWDMLTVI